MQPAAQVTQPHLLCCRFANLGCRAKFRQPLGRSSLDRPTACKDVVDVPWIMDIFDETKLAALAKGRSALDLQMAVLQFIALSETAKGMGRTDNVEDTVTLVTEQARAFAGNRRC